MYIENKGGELATEYDREQINSIKHTNLITFVSPSHNNTTFKLFVNTLILFHYTKLYKKRNNKNVSLINPIMKAMLRMMQGCEKPIKLLPVAVKKH